MYGCGGICSYKGNQQVKVLAFIPARSGSKGLPDKNIRPFYGKPLLAWSVQAALESGVCADVIVSTDSERYADIARQSGGDVPFLRPDFLSSDTASTLDAVWYTIDQLSKNGKTYESVIILQPTSPLRTAIDIRGAVDLFENKRATSIVSVCEVDHNPLWCNSLPSDHSMENFLSNTVDGRMRQQLSTYYRLNGAIYLAQLEALRKNKTFYLPGSFAYIMPRERSVDIDTELDFFIAERILQHIGK
jgi:CMP-N-acetylneuraminic acid synthetase